MFSIAQKACGMVRELAIVAPSMALIPDSQGNYPLRVAVHSQQSHDVMRVLCRACPNAGKIRDLEPVT